MSIADARRRQKKIRAVRREIIRQYVGSYWSENGTWTPVPVNLIAFYVGIISRSLIAKNPRMMCSTFHMEYKAIATAMQSFGNTQIEHMKLVNTLQRGVVNALISFAVVKVAIATPSDAAVYSWRLKAGMPFASDVDPDDMAWDPHATEFEQCQWMANRYRVPLDTVRDSSIYTKARKNLTASTDPAYDRDGEERSKRISLGYSGTQEEFEDMVDLWEVYLPRHQLVVTLSDDDVATYDRGGDQRWLRVQNWIGPETGPYHILGYGVTPSNAMPKAPLQDLFQIHLDANETYRKFTRTLARMKEVLLFRKGGDDDMQRINETPDGHSCGVDQPDDIKPTVMSGQALQPLYAMATALKDLFSHMGNNLELLGGQSPQSKTATQDEMLNQNAGAGIADMQDRTTGWVQEIIRALGWYWHHHPSMMMDTAYQVPGTPITIPRSISPQQRQTVPWEKMDITMELYSMRHSTPRSRMQDLTGVVQNTIMPMMGLLQQQGIAFDIGAYLKTTADYLDMPDLQNIVKAQPPPPPQQQGQPGGQPEEPGMPANTNREYTRRNVPQDNPGNQDQMMRMLGHDMGGAQQGATMGGFGA